MYLSEKEVRSLNYNMSVDSKRAFLRCICAVHIHDECRDCPMDKMCGEFCDHIPLNGLALNDYRVHKLFEAFVN